MSYSLALKNGDLATTGAVVTLCSGKNKLAQDLDLWLKEIYQVDRFHPSYGSVLESFVGSIVGMRAAHDIETEVFRVLANYQNLQIRRLKTNPTKFTPDELLQQVISVTPVVSYDTIIVTVTYRTGGGAVRSTQLDITV